MIRYLLRTDIMSFSYHTTQIWNQQSRFGQPLRTVRTQHLNWMTQYISWRKCFLQWSSRWCHVNETEAKCFRSEHLADEQLEKFTISPKNSSDDSDTDKDTDTSSPTGTLPAVTDKQDNADDVHQDI
jgi:hypothetical protein